MTRRQLLHAISNIVWQVSKECPCCPQGALVALIETPTHRDDWTIAGGGPGALRDVVLDLHASLPCACGSRETAH